MKNDAINFIEADEQKSTSACEITHLDFLDYQSALDIQEESVRDLQAGSAGEKFYLLQHPHVITLGRGGNPLNLLIDEEALKKKGVEFFKTGRGGDITYHGPGQLVGYPILQLKGEEKDVRKYMNRVEEIIIRTLKDYGIESGRIPGLTGVWVGDEKIAAIGVRLSRWITSHGFALNVNTDLRFFQLITPCGILDKGVTSMERCLGRTIDIREVSEKIVLHFEEVFGRVCHTEHAFRPERARRGITRHSEPQAKNLSVRDPSASPQDDVKIVDSRASYVQ